MKDELSAMFEGAFDMWRCSCAAVTQLFFKWTETASVSCTSQTAAYISHDAPSLHGVLNRVRLDEVYIDTEVVD